MNHDALLIPAEKPKAKRKIAQKTNQHFRLGLDTLTQMTLNELQSILSTPKLSPSRTLVTREAIRRYGQEVRSRIAQGDRSWLDAETSTLTGMAQRGPK